MEVDERQSLMIAQRHNLSLFIAKLLNIRKISDNDVVQFLNPELLEYLPDPFKLRDMTKSIERIINTISSFWNYFVDK